MVGFQALFGANLSHVETQSMPVSMTVARKLRDWILGDDNLATFPTVVLLFFVALWKVEKACTSVLRVLLWPFTRSDPREEVLHFQRATGMGDNLAFAAIDLYIAQKLGYKKHGSMVKVPPWWCHSLLPRLQDARLRALAAPRGSPCRNQAGSAFGHLASLRTLTIRLDPHQDARGLARLRQLLPGDGPGAQGGARSLRAALRRRAWRAEDRGPHDLDVRHTGLEPRTSRAPTALFLTRAGLALP